MWSLAAVPPPPQALMCFEMFFSSPWLYRVITDFLSALQRGVLTTELTHTQCFCLQIPLAHLIPKI